MPICENVIMNAIVATAELVVVDNVSVVIVFVKRRTNE